MTPALKAMVEAMAAEFERQGQDEPFEWIDASETLGRLSVLTYEGAACRFDLEKVARAGLEAIRTPTTAIEASDPGVNLPWWFEGAFDDVLDAILKDQP